MWDNPRRLDTAANLVLALLAAALLATGLEALLRSSLFPLRELTVLGRLAHTGRAEIERAAAGLAGNFFAADLGALRAALEGLPWVRRVEARRVWPDRIEVTFEEHAVLAHWGDAGLVNTHGERFAARLEGDGAARLPIFAGPAGSEAEVARRYRRFVEILAPLGERPERVILTPRHAWQLRLAGGLKLELGRDGAEPVEQRLARFVAAWPGTFGHLPRPPEHIDLRYPNGFALRIPEWRG